MNAIITSYPEYEHYYVRDIIFDNRGNEIIKMVLCRRLKPTTVQ